MPQTLPLSFETVLAEAQASFLNSLCSRYDQGKGYTSWHPASGLRSSGKTPAETADALVSISGFVDMELGLRIDYGRGRWTYAQYAMAHALQKAGWTHRRIGKAIGKSKNAVTGLLYRETPWRTVADTRAGGWSAEDTAAVVHLRDTDKWKWRDIAEAVGWSECYCRLRYRETKNKKPEEPHCARV